MGDSLSLIDKKIKITKVTISITKIDTPINKQSLMCKRVLFLKFPICITFICYFFYGTQLVFDLFFNDTFIYYFFYVIVKERLAIEFIVLNCSINQKTHNNMSVNVFPLSHQAGTIGRHAYSNHICFSAKGASLRFYSPSCFCRAIQIGRLLWDILR